MTTQTKVLYKSLLQRADRLKKYLSQQVTSLPDNHLNYTAANCFIISSSVLERGRCLSPEYYNFRVQYKRISEKIQKAKIENLDSCILSILTDSRYHPTVQQSLASLWGI
jgi:hypothetical protein